jgi:DNA-binding XRE family transcriptional regulator
MNDTPDLLLRLEKVEAERDALALRLAVLEDAGVERVPAALAHRLMAGEIPVRVWREYRGLSLHALAEQAGISPSMLSEIENGKKEGSVRTLAALARALRVDLDDLVSWS